MVKGSPFQIFKSNQIFVTGFFAVCRVAQKWVYSQ